MEIFNGALRQLIFDRFDTLKWRHHGIGALQAYIVEDVDPEIRVHIFHPDLVRPGITESGSFHDHRFDLMSTVLVGKLYDTQAFIAPHTGLYRKWQVWNVENARSAGQESNYDGACSLASPECFLADLHTEVRTEGMTYIVPRGKFHETTPLGLCVTVCELRDKRGQARLLIPEGKSPVHAFGDEWLSESALGRIVSDARYDLLDFRRSASA